MILSVAVLPALCLVFYSRFDRLSKLLVVMSVLYWGLTLMTGRKMIHYFVPLSFLLPVAFVRYCQSPRVGSRVGSGQLLLWLTTLLVLIAVIFPGDREPYARSSEFGRRTLMAFDSDGQAVGKATEVAKHYLVPHWSRAFQDKNWSLGPWEWVYYARLGRDARIDDGIDHVVSDAALDPDGFTLLYRVGDTFFYVRDVSQFIEQLRSAPENDFRPALLAYTRYFKSYDTEYVERTIRANTAAAEQLSLLPEDSERQKMMAYLSNQIRDLRSYIEAQGSD
jgi:hypothetical protein